MGVASCEGSEEELLLEAGVGDVEACEFISPTDEFEVRSFGFGKDCFFKTLKFPIGLPVDCRLDFTVFLPLLAPKLGIQAQ
jgi:hypothetical protein